MVSGYFVYMSFVSKRKRFKRFLADKIIRLYPTWLIILFIYAIYSLVFPQFYEGSSYDHWGMSLVREILLLQSVGISDLFNVNLIKICHTAWYVSVYFYGSLLLYYILSHFSKRYVVTIFSAIVIGVYGFYFLVWNGTMEIWDYKGVFFIPLWRGLAGMSLGILVGMVLKRDAVGRWLNANSVCFNALSIVAFVGAFYSFFASIDIEWAGIICFVCLFANSLMPSGLGSYFNRWKFAKYIPDISLEILLLHKILITVSVKICDFFGVLYIDIVKYTVYAVVVIVVSLVFNKLIVPQIKKGFETVITSVS